MNNFEISFWIFVGIITGILITSIFMPQQIIIIQEIPAQTLKGVVIP